MSTIVEMNDGNQLLFSQNDFDRLAELYGGEAGAMNAATAAWDGFAQFVQEQVGQADAKQALKN